MRRNVVEDEDGVLGRDDDGMRPKILQKLQVLDVQRVILGGGADPIRQPQGLRIGLPWRTAPLPRWRLVIAGRHPHSQHLEGVQGFPFFPAGRVVAQDEEIRRVPLRGMAPRDRAIAQGHPPGLIVIFHHIVIAFHRVDGPQLDMLAFKLDGALHFGTGIPPRHIAGPSGHRAHRGRGPYSGNTVDRVRRELETAAPRVKGVCGQHRSYPAPEKTGYGAAIRAHKYRRSPLQMRAV